MGSRAALRGACLGCHIVFLVGEYVGRGRRVVFSFAPCITLPRGSGHWASPCCSAVVVVTLRPTRPVLQSHRVLFAPFAIVHAIVLNEEGNEGHDDVYKPNSVWLYFLADGGFEVEEGGNGLTPSAASISLPSIVSFRLIVGCENYASAL